MSKTFMIGVLVAVIVYPATVLSESVEEGKSELIKAGLSEGAAQGLADIGKKYEDQFKQMNTEFETFIATQPEADQQIYKKNEEKILQGTTVDDVKAELVKAGISEAAANGLADIGKKYENQFKQMKSEYESFMSTQSEADKEIYKKYEDKILQE